MYTWQDELDRLTMTAGFCKAAYREAGARLAEAQRDYDKALDVAYNATKVAAEFKERMPADSSEPYFRYHNEYDNK